MRIAGCNDLIIATLRLMPFTMAELEEENIDHFITREGFLEPYLAESDSDARRWRNEYINDLIRFDILD